jgi:hypothetical protein
MLLRHPLIGRLPVCRTQLPPEPGEGSQLQPLPPVSNPCQYVSVQPATGEASLIPRTLSIWTPWCPETEISSYQRVWLDSLGRPSWPLFFVCSKFHVGATQLQQQPQQQQEALVMHSHLDSSSSRRQSFILAILCFNSSSSSSSWFMGSFRCGQWWRCFFSIFPQAPPAVPPSAAP